MSWDFIVIGAGSVGCVATCEGARQQMEGKFMTGYVVNRIVDRAAQFISEDAA